ncbi:MAG: histidine--tRNA ligase [Candidatus Wallbacteria bacterium]|nr:histidine--tRNA ligase [Candidatus Wallbacteria bacterium]
MINKPKGTNDILPEESYRWHFLEARIRDLTACYGYHEIRTPIFESTELFVRGVGDGTDIVDKEMYTFQDRSERSLTLRPEGTASAVRAYIEHGLHQKEERCKLYYIGPMFRYERPQAGRFRQHYQFGLELYGESSPWADVEVISVVSRLYAELGLSNVIINLNSIGCSGCRSEIRDTLRGFLERNLESLCEDCRRRYDKNPLRVLDCKNPQCKTIMSGSPCAIDSICPDCREHFEGVKHGLALLGIQYQINPALVRGLDYYTRTVFEFVSTGLGAQNAVGGGGRYDNLVHELGGPRLPAVGFSTGMERVILTMQNENADPQNTENTELRVIALGKEAEEAAFRLTYDLRRLGLRTDMDFRNKSLKAQLRLTDKMNEHFALIIGEAEIKERAAVLKDLAARTESKVSLDNAEQIVKNIRGAHA